MPLQRRLPKRGFNNVFKKQYAIVSLEQLDQFSAGEMVTVDTLVAAKLVKKGALVKILANGEISKALQINVDKVSEAAKAKIEQAGGTVVTTVAQAE